MMQLQMLTKLINSSKAQLQCSDTLLKDHDRYSAMQLACMIILFVNDFVKYRLLACIQNISEVLNILFCILGVRGSQGFTDGEHYWEVKFTEPPSGTSVMVGICTNKAMLHSDDQIKHANLLGMNKPYQICKLKN